jgi:uncharacterized NAD-dependent epimerase/dehydratase family protein
VVAVLDSHFVGQTAQDVFGIGGAIPVVASLNDAPGSANALLVGVATAGGFLPPPMRAIVLDAIGRGWQIISGLHQFLCNDDEFAAAAAKSGAVLFDVRKNNERDVARRRDINEKCLRIHTVGNDCSVGKMVASVEVARGLRDRGHDAKFIATGQTGIMIEGDGCPIDCVVADFINGAAEKLIRQNQHHEIVVVEGQGSLVHPSYSGVTLGLLHGCVPDGLIMVYEVGRTQVHGLEPMSLPPMDKIMTLYEVSANIMHPCRIIGFALNTRRCKTQDEVEAERERVQQQFGLPACDVYRDGPDALVDAVLKLKQEIGK